ncbi:NUDIX domain-containing protein [Histoplasma ohiense]|nr:NUDIX domain-containing protein [Histoplasma ohiense (nom. inval.)]
MCMCILLSMPCPLAMSLDSDKLFHLCDAFSISCGTVTLDPTQAKMLLIRQNKNQEILLPKGRKNIGEALENAALRETYEETGFRVTLFPLPIPTLATPEAAADTYGQLSAVTEPFAVSQRLVHNKLKLIFWFAAKGDSTTAPDTGTQQDGEDFEPIWAELDSGVKSLTFDDDRQIARAVIDVVSRAGYFTTAKLSGMNP